MTRSDRCSFLTPDEVKWHSDIQLKQCSVTFRNIDDIVQFLITRCWGPGYYDFLCSNLIPRTQDLPLYDPTVSYQQGDRIRFKIDQAPWVQYYEWTQVPEPPPTLPPPFDPPWTLYTGPLDAPHGEQIKPYLPKHSYYMGERATYGGRYWESTKSGVLSAPGVDDSWEMMPRFYDPTLEEFYCNHLVNWLAFNVWYHKLPFIRGQQEDATIQFRFVDYQIAEEALQSLRQEIQNHLYMIWENMKVSYPNYYPDDKYYPGCGCDSPTGEDCGTEALRKFAFRVA